jgi:hypothetical protein
MTQNGIDDNILNILLQRRLSSIDLQKQRLESVENIMNTSDMNWNIKGLLEIFEVDVDYYKLVMRKRKLKKIVDKCYYHQQK